MPAVTVRVHPLKTGEIRIPLVYRAPARRPLANLRALTREPRAWVPVPAFLVEHPTAGKLLVDTGYAASVSADPVATQGMIGGRVMFSHRAAAAPLREQVAARGVEPDDVRLVVTTHLHHDHVSGAAEWPRATFVADAAELAATRGPLAATRGYHRPVLDRVTRWQALDYRLGEPYQGLERTIDLFGDGSVRLVSTPGHSPGHQCVLLRLRGRSLLLLGDAVLARRQLHDGTVAGLIVDRPRYVQSLRALARHVAEHPRTIAVPSHDAALWDELPPVLE